MVKIAVVVYSVSGHVLELSKAEAEGAKSSGASVDVYQFPSSNKLEASTKTNYPEITPEKLSQYDGFLIGFPTRFGAVPFAVQSFLDATAGLWARGGLNGRFAGLFISTGTPNGGQETTVRNFMATLVHHGTLFVPLGYADAFADLTSFDEIHGGSPWGAGTYAGPDGKRQVSDLELKIARIQGKSFAEKVATGRGNMSPSSSNSG